MRDTAYMNGHKYYIYTNKSIVSRLTEAEALHTEMDKLEQEEAAATVFSYLIRGLSDGDRKSVKAELMQKLLPIKELYGLADDVYPVYVDFCLDEKKFLKVQDAVRVMGEAVAAGKVPPKGERAVMGWIMEVQNQNRTYGNIKTKRR